jgi:hypothetical protein
VVEIGAAVEDEHRSSPANLTAEQLGAAGRKIELTRRRLFRLRIGWHSMNSTGNV